MGMSASQARLLSITARLTNNENTGQAISYAKQRLADQTHQITDEYNNALDATKLTVLTGFNGAEANYEDISYNLMTGLKMAETSKQYIVTDTKNRVLVTEDIADAYNASNGNYNLFLAKLGYSQADIAVQKTYTDEKNRTPQQEATEQQIHEAWDKYFATVGINLGDSEHDFGFSFEETVAFGTQDLENSENYNIGDGYVGYARTKGYEQAIDENGQLVFSKYTLSETKAKIYDTNSEPIYDYSKPVYPKDSSGNLIYDPITYEGTTQESRDLYDYAMAITEAYLRVNTDPNNPEYKKTYDLDAVKSAADTTNKSALKYYRNLFNRIQQGGYFTYTDTPQKAKDNNSYIYSDITKGTNKIAKNPLKDNFTFEAALRDGTLRLEYYSSTDKAFKSTTISEDNCIQEVPDERAIARAESKYNQDMTDLENKDKKFDLELRKLDTEHKALDTEYESVKNVIQKNVESTFKVFS